jgi:outer membrane lipoprotein-sorting protein
MKHCYRFLFALLLASTVLSSTGCLFRSRTVERRISSAPLQTATAQELIARINSEAAKVQTMNATVDIAASTGGAKKGKVTDYTEIRGYVLIRKPSMLRMIGLFPVVRNRAFDMVSDGREFKLWVPTKNRFMVGSNEITKPSPQPLENLRPQHIYDALLLREIDPNSEVAVLEQDTQVVIDAKTKKPVDEPNYVINVIRRDVGGQWFLSRKVFFDRHDLLPHRQIVYDRTGSIATDATYDQFKTFGNLNFPAVISISRPQEEYQVTLKIVKMDLNKPLKDDQFALQQPQGSQLVRVGQPSEPVKQTSEVRK